MTTCYDTLPRHLQAEAQAYVEQGAEPSRLLLAALENNLFDTLDALPAGLSGDEARALLCTLATWVRLQPPVLSRGSAHLTEAWMRAGGLRGRAAARAATAAAEAVRRARSAGVPHLRVASTGGSVHGPLTDSTPPEPHAYDAGHLADTILRHGALHSV